MSIKPSVLLLNLPIQLVLIGQLLLPVVVHFIFWVIQPVSAQLIAYLFWLILFWPLLGLLKIMNTQYAHHNGYPRTETVNQDVFFTRKLQLSKEVLKVHSLSYSWTHLHQKSWMLLEGSYHFWSRITKLLGWIYASNQVLLWIKSDRFMHPSPYQHREFTVICL